jgi:large subunit ribosomal protein L1
MPNPKTGTVTDDTAAAVQAVKAGRVDFKLDRNGNISVPIGRVGFSEQQLAENGEAVIDAIKRAKPASAKGRYIDSATMAATMSPGVPLQGNLYATV